MSNLIFHRTLPHYRVGILKHLHERFGFTWVHSSSKWIGVTEGQDKGNSIRVRSLEIKLKRGLGAETDALVLMDVLSPIHRLKPRIVIVQFELSMLSIWLLFLLRWFYGYKLILWGHGYDRTRGFRPDIRRTDKVRMLWIRWSDAVILYNENRRVEITRFFKDSSKLFVANNTLDLDELLPIKHECDQIGRAALKQDLGFGAKYNLIFVARLVKDKQPDYLVDVFSLLSQQRLDLHLHIVGKGPMQDQLVRQVEQQGLQSSVTFWGEIIDPQQLGRILYACDAMIMPGFVGLSIVHAFCFGLPVITQAQGDYGPFHSTEIEYLVPGKTGFFAPPGDKAAMAEMIAGFLSDEDCILDMRKNIQDMVAHQCSIEKMMSGFSDALAFVNQKQKHKGEVSVKTSS